MSTSPYFIQLFPFATVLLEGSLSNVPKILTESAFCSEHTSANETEVRTLHPNRTILIILQLLQKSFSIDKSEVRRALNRLPSSSGPGPDGLLSPILKSLPVTPGGSPPDLFVPDEFTKLLNIAAKGLLSQAARAWVPGALRLDLSKDAGQVLRLIAIVVTLRKFLCRIQKRFSGDIDAIINATRTLTNSLRNEDVVPPNIDVLNAFKSANGQKMLY